MRRERLRFPLQGGCLPLVSSPDSWLAFLWPVEDVEVTEDGVADLISIETLSYDRYTFM